MRTVTFTLQGPMQSWANRPATAVREAGQAPTKCAVIGLVANALGRDRDEAIDDLAALRIAVRHDRPGIVEVDYHTIGSGRMPLLPGEVHDDPRLRAAANRHGFDAAHRDYHPVAGEKDLKGEATVKVSSHLGITRDYYLADAAFTVALEGDPVTVTAVADALNAPARPLFLCRKSHPAATPPDPAIHDGDLLDALAARPVAGGALPEQCAIDIEDGHGTWIADQPTSFATRRRGKRRHRTIPPTVPTGTDFFTPEHP